MLIAGHGRRDGQVETLGVGLGRRQPVFFELQLVPLGRHHETQGDQAIEQIGVGMRAAPRQAVETCRDDVEFAGVHFNHLGAV